MADLTDLKARLRFKRSLDVRLYVEALAAIEALEAERDELRAAVQEERNQGFLAAQAETQRAEKAEADLAAARRALRVVHSAHLALALKYEGRNFAVWPSPIGDVIDEARAEGGE